MKTVANNKASKLQKQFEDESRRLASECVRSVASNPDDVHHRNRAMNHHRNQWHGVVEQAKNQHIMVTLSYEQFDKDYKTAKLFHDYQELMSGPIRRESLLQLKMECRAPLVGSNDYAPNREMFLSDELFVLLDNGLTFIRLAHENTPLLNQVENYQMEEFVMLKTSLRIREFSPYVKQNKSQTSRNRQKPSQLQGYNLISSNPESKSHTEIKTFQ